MIPDWLAQENQPMPPVSQSRSTGTAFLERTIEGAARFLREAILTEAAARKKGLLQALDPRVKLVTLLALIFCISIMRSPAAIWGMYCFTLLLAGASSIPLPSFMKRVWLFIPLFSAIIVVPAMFNVITPGEPVWTIFHLGRSHDIGPYHVPETIAVTRQGLLTAATFIGRVAASVSLAVLLTLTTPWSDLLRALRVLRVPRIFILTLAMAYRYIIILVQTIHGIHIARKSRTLRYGAIGDEQRWVASRIGFLFKRTWTMSQDVHRAMLSRGFSGDVRSLAVFKARPCDRAWCVFIAVVCAVGLIIDFSTLHW